MPKSSNQKIARSAPADEDSVRLLTRLLTEIVNTQHAQQRWIESISDRLDAVLDRLGTQAP